MRGTGAAAGRTGTFLLGGGEGRGFLTEGKDVEGDAGDGAGDDVGGGTGPDSFRTVGGDGTGTDGDADEFADDRAGGVEGRGGGGDRGAVRVLPGPRRGDTATEDGTAEDSSAFEAL